MYIQEWYISLVNSNYLDNKLRWADIFRLQIVEVFELLFMLD